MHSGFKTGLFTSPHIDEFSERICIDEQRIPEDVVIDYFDEIESIVKRQELNVTFFDFVTMIAFMHFREQKVDYGVIECVCQ